LQIKNKKNIICSNPYYIPIKQGGVQQLYIYRKDGKGEDALFFNKNVTITLHFKRFPFVL
jgi:hypothetical protein